MQNLLAIMFLGLLLVTVFWPEEAARQNDRSHSYASNITEVDQNKANRQDSPAVMSGGAMFYHYLGMQERPKKAD